MALLDSEVHHAFVEYLNPQSEKKTVVNTAIKWRKMNS